MGKIYIVSKFDNDHSLAIEKAFNNRVDAERCYDEYRKSLIMSYTNSVENREKHLKEFGGVLEEPTFNESVNKMVDGEPTLKHIYYYYFRDTAWGEWGFIALKETEVGCSSTEIEAKKYIAMLTERIKDAWRKHRYNFADMSWVDNWVESLYTRLNLTNERYTDMDVLQLLLNCFINNHGSTCNGDYDFLDDIFCEEVLHNDYVIVIPSEFTENMTDDEVEFADGVVAELQYPILMAIYNNDKKAIDKVRDDIDHRAITYFDHTILTNSPYRRMSFEDFAHEYGCEISMERNVARYVDFCDAEPTDDKSCGRWYRLSYERINGDFKFAISGLCEDYDRIEMCQFVDDITREMFASVADFHSRKESLQTDAYSDYYVWIEKKAPIHAYGEDEMIKATKKILDN